MDQAALLVKLNTRLRDTDNFAFTSDEKTEALTEAMNDESAVTPVWDSSLTFAFSTYQYARPATIDVIQDIYIRRGNSTDNDPEKIPSEFWEVVGSNIQFKFDANGYIPDGFTLYLKGYKKYTSASTITETNVQEYVLNLAQLICLNMFGTIKAIRFVNNDTSMSEIIAQKRELERKVSQYKQRLPRSFELA